jgi:RHS repeat-associated protein
VQFTYDSKNRVVKRTTNGVSLFLIYDRWSLIEERDGSGAVLQKYINGANIDEVLVKVSTTGSVYYHQDGLGSTTLLTDSAGNIVEKYSHDIFGKVTIANGSGTVIPATLQGNRFLFTGREWLSEVGLYDYRNRVYSCELGRFLQVDPIGFDAGDVNIYRYVGNRTINEVDPEGLYGWPDLAHGISNPFEKCTLNQTNSCMKGCKAQKMIFVSCEVYTRVILIIGGVRKIDTPLCTCECP